MKANIAFIKNFDTTTLAKLDKVSQENYQLLKEDTETFTDFSIFDVVPDAAATLESWVKTVKATIKEVELPKPLLVKAQKKEKKVSAPIKTTEKKEVAKLEKLASEKLSEESDKNKLLKQTLRDEIKQMLEQVKENSKFKDKIFLELSKYLQKNQTGLGARKDDELTKLKARHKFYKNLLKGDTADFKAIAKKVGLSYTISKPRAKRAKKGLLGVKKPKKEKTLGQKISSFFGF
ncbi:hypothetical protein [Arcicella lustrica]|uniref:Uncharacterized protein n=1 Tax=Arcicella lustrica TaxID=2984196 RepID=A0ABU5SDN7_9BACT|nr:hypothetical protein [Arcicella sp. DC25W]MEA5425398.1 hypothetical protein [Arcicella sp. DC25W]